jgi:hypothetical protein
VRVDVPLEPTAGCDRILCPFVDGKRDQLLDFALGEIFRHDVASFPDLLAIISVNP